MALDLNINCGVRLLRTDLTYKEVLPRSERLATSLFDTTPARVGSERAVVRGPGVKELAELLKAVTYHELMVFGSPGEWRARIIFDV